MRRIVRVLACLVVVSAGVAALQPASAQDSAEKCEKVFDLDGGTKIVCTARRATTETSPATYPAFYRPPRPPGLPTTPTSTPSQPRKPRIVTIYEPPPPGACHAQGQPAVLRDGWVHPARDDPWIDYQFAQRLPPCPGVAVDAKTTVVEALEQVPLPAPAPHIAPGFAITGKLGYLEEACRVLAVALGCE